MMKSTMNRKVETRDLGQISALMAIGLQPSQLRHEDGVLVAEFPDSPEVQLALQQYITDQLRVPPRSFLALMRDLRGFAKSGRQFAGTRPL